MDDSQRRRPARPPLACWVTGIGLALVAAAAPAQAEDAAGALPDWLAVHGQTTVTAQATPSFRSPYVGPNSLTPRQAKETVDATLFLGVRPWAGGELWVNPEIDQGFGLSNTLGVAGFPSAEAYKVGQTAPYFRIQRLFFRQSFATGGEAAPIEGVANQFGGRQAANRIVLTIGKFGVADIFDTNRYAHDPRSDFLNWALVDTGTFDYAAEAWGYSSGVAIEDYTGPWTLRLGGFNLSKVPNGETLERDFSQYQIDAELEHRHRLAGRDGAVRLTIFRNRGRFARYADALAEAADGPPDLTPVRRPSTRWGASLNLEQAVSDTVGLFARAGAADGQIEPYDFTDIDRTLALGSAIDGKAWGRDGDQIGAAGVINAISDEHRRYLAAGGLGVLVGDGRLPRYATEAIGEVYYQLHPLKPVTLTFDVQLIGNPGYNPDRGPVSVFGLRLHGQF